jgi:hypothetical protein
LARIFPKNLAEFRGGQRYLGEVRILKKPIRRGFQLLGNSEKSGKNTKIFWNAVRG